MNIKNGTTRTVFLIGDYAFKIPSIKYDWKMFAHGMLANDREKIFSELNDPHLMPVLFSAPFGLLNIMPKGLPITHLYEKNSIDPESMALKIAEKKIDSWKRWNGKVVAVDYG